MNDNFWKEIKEELPSALLVGFVGAIGTIFLCWFTVSLFTWNWRLPTWDNCDPLIFVGGLAMTVYTFIAMYLTSKPNDTKSAEEINREMRKHFKKDKEFEK